MKLQWIKEPPREITVSLNHELKLDCLAQGEPRPAMRWEKLIGSDSTSFRRNNNQNNLQQQSLINGFNFQQQQDSGGKNQLTASSKFFR